MFIALCALAATNPYTIQTKVYDLGTSQRIFTATRGARSSDGVDELFGIDRASVDRLTDLASAKKITLISSPTMLAMLDMPSRMTISNLPETELDIQDTLKNSATGLHLSCKFSQAINTKRYEKAFDFSVVDGRTDAVVLKPMSGNPILMLITVRSS